MLKINKCKGCKNYIKKGELLVCPNCGIEYCFVCASKTKKICPKCYHNLEIIG